MNLLNSGCGCSVDERLRCRSEWPRRQIKLISRLAAGRPSIPLGDELSGGKLCLDATRFSKTTPLPRAPPPRLTGLTSPKTLDGQAVSRLPRFIFYSQTEKLSRRFRVLVCNRHRLAPPRREHIVGSTFVWFPYGHACLNASGACYRRGGSAHYCLVLRRHRISSRLT